MVENKKSKKNISKRVLYALIAIGILAVAGIGVYALVPGTAPNPGHTIDQLAPPSPCETGNSLKWTGSSWSCENALDTNCDVDGDTYLSKQCPYGTDCDDTNSDVHPDQTIYFTTPYTTSSGGSSFDYNCSGTITKDAGNYEDVCTKYTSGQYSCSSEYYCPECLSGPLKSTPTCGWSYDDYSDGNCVAQAYCLEQSSCGPVERAWSCLPTTKTVACH